MDLDLHTIKKNRYPIQNQRVINKSFSPFIKDPLNDTISSLFVGCNNFWFCYATIDINSFENEYKWNFDKIEPQKKDSKILEIFESIIFWSLRGLTISTISKKFDNNNLTRLLKNININTNLCSSIFKEDLSDLEKIVQNPAPEVASDILFPGNY